MTFHAPAVLRSALACLSLVATPPVVAQAAGPLNPVLVRAPGGQSPYLLGAWQGGRWVPASAGLAHEVRSGAYRRHMLGGRPATAQGGPAESMGDPCADAYQVPLTPESPASAFEVFTTSAQVLQPRPVTLLPTSNTTYREIVRQELVRRGVRSPVVTITTLLRTDLDGNGTQEVVIEASRFQERSGNFPPPTGQPGDYSLLLLRHVAGGKAVTTVLGEYVAPPTPYDPASTAPMPLATTYRLAGLADLNGDGRVELITYGAYYEGDSFAAQEWTPASGLKVRLETGCGV
ncbi:hypothetical protein E7T09_19230 [Deinococcus sp. KSM4-11]|uniref:hypothetical protein n=1 Tax=Deinococcus sp. KSM4-11 TaxID=2568654 RepID=UPI0010A496EF|nr:hypothetical protein [Deinococcus sp. KSM4-11]THF84769.1 hypothetical protein E7T09_19230 [Deinococcus sp. KSM4-11]